MQKNYTYAVWSLRLGLAAMFGYSGIDILLHPTAWYWAVRGLPLFVQNIINTIGIDTYLMLQGASEVFFALVFLLWMWPRLTRVVALFAAVEMALILLMVGVDSITFRDFGPLGAAIALFFLL
ncbi:MAG: hypothetical protein A3H64_01825 [Candidatus Ryanbacteria bacterium RIFCSPLOWO2_02_FULL_45_11c]|uniref:DoxX family protein n=1 Tax=Candidatus Ryanbacteria bacterium RIFCSPLOWO2_02_FULL_45_11c TaxID=1802128 RepID=A0A1G2H2G1_9BACT|nr:MAG: hypothetical protein A3H64_01825 [Candidatus Ryanbacteria bacterium RIFCSPLOWO2_02_FULL_45_11c]